MSVSMFRFVLIAIFILALALRLWFNFVFPHINNAGAADGSEYLRLAAALHQYFSRAGDLQALSGFKQAGPAFPLFMLFCQAAAGIFGSMPDWAPPVFGQCILAAVADVLLCLTANLLFGRQPALFCAAFAAFYPAYLINSGRLYTESFSTSLCVIILYIMCRGFVGGKRNKFMYVGLGIALASLQLTRSVMILLSLLSLPLTFFQEFKSAEKSAVAILLVSMAAAVLPWLVAQQAIFNKSSLVVDRVGNYNLFVGTNPDISGWLSYPYPDGNGIEKRSALSIIKENVKRSPSRAFKLLLDKPYRLAKFPWNDFRTEVGPYTFPFQVAYHQLLLLMCAVGLCISFVRNENGEFPPAGILKGRLLLVLYLAGHVIYCFFITVPRYNMTATPVLILFAAAGAANLLYLCKQNPLKGGLLFSAFLLLFFSARWGEIGLFYGLTGNPILALVVLCLLKAIFAALFFAFLWKQFPKPSQRPRVALATHACVAALAVFLVACPARANGRPFEWRTVLKESGDKVVQTIRLDKTDVAALKGEQLYLLIDLDGSRDFIESGRLTVNGEQVNGPFVPGIALTQDFTAEKVMKGNQIYFECEWIYDCMTAAAGISSSDIRQWFVVPLPPQAVQKMLASGSADVEVENTRGSNSIKIFGAYEPVGMSPTVNSSSWEKAFYGVENDRGFTDSRYDERREMVRHTGATFVSKQGKNATDLSYSAGKQNGSFNVLLLGSKGANSTNCALSSVVCESLPAKVSLTNGSGTARLFSSKISTSLPAAPNEVWLIRLKGRSFVRQAPGGYTFVVPKVNVLLEDSAGKKLIYPCRWMPRKLPAESSPTAFDYCFPMIPAQLKEKISAVEISLEPQGSDSHSGRALEIDDLSLEILSIPANPLAGCSRKY